MNKKPFKFDVGDIVYYLSNFRRQLRVRKGEVVRIEYEKNTQEEPILTYKVRRPDDDLYDYVDDYQVFAAKEELIEHLRSQSDE